MRGTRIAVIAALLLAAAPAAGQAANAWRPISTHAPEVRPALGAALEAVPSRSPLAGIFRAEQQFLGAQVAYRLILVLADQSKWRVTLVPQSGGGLRASKVEAVP